ncbi:MAG: lipopolysaccharide biosynthesis protein, partial [Pygmaiobacter sp.]
MDKYKRLLSNTMLFGISSFASKVLVFLLMPFFTHVLKLGDFGDANLITKYAQLLLPLVSIGIANSVIRFGLDKTYNKASVFTGGFVAIGI